MATTTFSGPVNADNGFVSKAQTGAAAALGSATNALNTTNKVAGLQVTDLDDGLIYTASGSGATDVWYGSDGTSSVTPS
jgi:hypothetical protein